LYFRQKALGCFITTLALCGCTKDAEQNPESETKTQKAKDAVEVKLYTMSKCPHGARTAIPMLKAAQKLKGLVDLQIDYIVRPQGDGFRSLHGQPEIKGNIYQLCAKKLDATKFGPFVTCVSKQYRRIPRNWKQCAQKVGLNQTALQKCADGKQGKALLRASMKRAQKAGARSSPTIVIAGKKYRGRRSTRGLMRAICKAAEKKPAACAKIPAPVKVDMIVLSDKRCKSCRTQRYERKLKSIFPGIRIKKVDYATAEGKKIFKNTGIEMLPALFFAKNVEKSEAYGRFRRNFQKKGDYYQLRVAGKFAPARKETKGRLDLFVMSMCPYGTKALDSMKGVLETFGEKFDFNIYYIAKKTKTGFRALHRQPEIDENIRELCAIKHYPKNYKYMDYIWCRNKNIRSKDWQKCTGKNGIKTAVIKKCFEGEEGKKLLTENIKLAQALHIGGSPTWLVNNKYVFKGFGDARIKKNFCKYNQQNAVCKNHQTGKKASHKARTAKKARAGAARKARP
jgi:predicted DsbA family dithiol-disulfide isomerase